MPRTSLGMTEFHRDLLVKHNHDLRRDIQTMRLMSYMDDVFIQDDEEDIQKCKTPTERADKFLELLQQKGPNAFEKFVLALEYTGQCHLSKPLREEGQLGPPPSTPYQPIDGSQGTNILTSSLLQQNLVTSSDISTKDLNLTEDPKMSIEDNTAQYSHQPYQESPDGAKGTTASFVETYHRNPQAQDKLRALPPLEGKEYSCVQHLMNDLNVNSDHGDQKTELKEKNICDVIESLEPNTDLGILITSLVIGGRSDIVSTLTDWFPEYLSKPHSSVYPKSEAIAAPERDRSGASGLVSTKFPKPGGAEPYRDDIPEPGATGAATANKRQKQSLYTRQTHISDLPFEVRNRLEVKGSICVDTGEDWRCLAAKLGYIDYIELWKQKDRKPMETLLQNWQTKKDATVGNLIEKLHECGMEKCAVDLEENL